MDVDPITGELFMGELDLGQLGVLAQALPPEVFDDLVEQLKACAGGVMNHFKITPKQQARMVVPSPSFRLATCSQHLERGLYLPDPRRK